jgi:hypothetical protein
VLFVIEDLNWADRSTRDLLTFLGRNLRDERCSWSAPTARTSWTAAIHWRRGWRRRSASHAWNASISRGSGEPRLVELLTAIAAAPPPLSSSIDARRCDGNAFFAEELAAAVDEAGHRETRLPETLRVSCWRACPVVRNSAHLVEVAAVAGREVGHDVLADVCGLSNPT